MSCNIRIVDLTSGSAVFFAIISVTDTSQVSFSGNTVTINPVADLLPNHDYEVRMPVVGTIKDIAGNSFAALANPINFSTGDFLLSSRAASPGVISGTSGNDVLAGTAGDNTILGGLGTDTFVWTTTDGSADGRGIDTIDATIGERLDFNLSLFNSLHLSNGSALLDGGAVLAGALHGAGIASLSFVDPSTLAFDWNGDGLADLQLKFMTTPHLLTYDGLLGDFVVG